MEDKLLNVLFSNNSECCACGFFTLLILSSILMPLLGSSQYNLSMLIVCNSWSIMYVYYELVLLNFEDFF